MKSEAMGENGDSLPEAVNRKSSVLLGVVANHLLGKPPVKRPGLL
jgi:hypothetical protein